ncbi:tRNA uracil 4-sulfurtransferase ThiI [Methanosarcina sp.]|uniref:tRNA uracil 4-sulfurtransferase ThiI n=1 Tax=Methanosarcina sp. TaxID=2213 RepID=UPI00298888EF|nr:tRNA uracil 4-sulfurtransferase ThiI [Methanosarcina sp.]MDW5550695.1 tRNA uracil 4-sulfurtransferase ThiI [Methanosarcina sp.]MDW5552458.1 tRNA uracil 4-sulfurtransferase ThiI [Methanosarcina sp.]MDW5560189.1 tRNA uracil 4-sulfurtransferase ThiI [Methanosarcina sp.]
MVKEKIESDIPTHQINEHVPNNDTKKLDYPDSESSYSGYGVQTDVIIVRYGELALKSTGVRNWYEKILMKNIAAMLDSRDIPYSQIRREWGRIFIETTDVRAAEVAADVFGIVSTSPALTAEPNLESTASVCAALAKNLVLEGESFAIRARRSGNHTFSSADIGRTCGDAVWSALQKEGKHPRVNLSSPDKEIFVEMRQNLAYIYLETFKGVGGLPLGTQGSMVVLMSGGLDSPVAAWLMMKRGVMITPVYCSNSPYAEDAARERAFDCIRQLQKWAPGHQFTTYEIPHGPNLKAFIDICNRKNTCLLCKRMMYREAYEVMKKESASGIITGSSLGQVASQTAANMHAEIYQLAIPIYHPLIALDKTEIMDIARKIGTYDISNRSAGSCTAVPERPEIGAKYDLIVLEERKMDIEAMVFNAVKAAKVLKL